MRDLRRRNGVGGTVRSLGRWWTVVVLVATTVATVAATSAVPVAAEDRAAPSCATAPPAVVGSSRDRLIVTVPQCASSTGLTGYRVLVERAPSGSSVGSVDVPVGVVQAQSMVLQAGTAYRFRVAARNADGTGPPSGASAPASPPFTTLTALTDQQYADFAGRAPTAGERADWVARLGDGRLTPVSAVDAAEQFTHWQAQPPNIRLYQAFFLRRPDLSGLNYWSDNLRSGRWGLNSISEFFSQSAEFRQRYGTLTNRQFIDLIYQNILGRPGEASGVAFWTAELDSGRRNRGRVMTGFSESPEYKAKTQGSVDVIDFFTGMLRRVPTTAELDEWAPRPRAEVITFLLGSAAYEARVGVTAPPAVTTDTLPSGATGIAYPATSLTALGGTGTLTWAIASGSLPTGLALSTAGRITGTPTAAGTSTFTVRVTDGAGRSNTKTFAVTVTTLAITTASLPNGQTAAPYSATLAASGGGPYTWSLQTGTLPAGLTLNTSSGAITGTPTAAGTSSFTARVTASGGRTASKSLSIVIAGPVITTSSLPNGQTGLAYSTTLAVTGIGSPTWSLQTGSLPAGLTLNTSTGAITGTPTAAGTSSFTARVTGTGGSATKALSIVVYAPSDWSQPRHDAAHTGWAPTENVITPANAPQVRQEWDAPSAEAAIVGSTIYRVGPLDTDPDQPVISAASLTDGTVAWQVPIDPSACGGGSPLVTASTVILVCGGSAHAYSRTGSHGLLWSTGVTDPGNYISSGSVIGSTLVAWAGDRVAAYRLSDGQRLWQQGLPSGATGVLDVAAAGSTVVVGYDDRLRGLNLSTGAQTWVRTGATTTDVIIAGDWIYTNDDAGVARFALTTGAPGWDVREGTGIYRVLAADADTIYVWEATFDFGPPSPSILRALRTSDGGQRWEYDVPERIGAVAVTGDLVWLTSTSIFSQGRSSDLIALNRTSGAERHRTHFEDNMYSSGNAVFGGGRVVFQQGGSSGEATPGRLRVFGLADPLPVVDPTVLPLARTGTAYSQALTASAGTPGFTWSVTGGTLPAGLTLASNGTLAGTPSAIGNRRITVRVTDTRGRTATRSLTLAVVGGAPGDWTTTGRDASGNAFDPGDAGVGLDTAPGLAYRWRTQNQTADANVDPYRQPLVVGTRLYDTGSDGKLKAWTTTGTATNRIPVWQAVADQTTPGTYFSGAATHSGGVLYLLDSNGALEAVRASDGVHLWTSSTTSTLYGPGPSAPLIVGTRILVKDHELGGVRAFSTVDGSPLWGGATTVLTTSGPGSDTIRPLTSDGTLAFARSGCDLYALRLTTGAVAWTIPIPAPADAWNCADYGIAAPVVVDGVVYAGSNQSLVAVDAATGTLRWRRSNVYYGSGVVVGGLWIVSGSYIDPGTVTAFDTTTGAMVWRRIGSGSVFDTSTVSAGADLIVLRTGTSIKAISRLTGEDIWDGGTFDPVSGLVGPATVARGRIYISTYGDGVRAYGPLT